MNKQRVFGRQRCIAPALALTLTILAATGCCLAVPQARVDDTAAGDIAAAESIPILVTLAAEEGEALATARRRVLERLRSAMPAEAFAAVRVYETLPVIALAATPEVIALLLMLPEVSRIEADQEFANVVTSPNIAGSVRVPAGRSPATDEEGAAVPRHATAATSH